MYATALSFLAPGTDPTGAPADAGASGLAAWSDLLSNMPILTKFLAFIGVGAFIFALLKSVPHFQKGKNGEGWKLIVGGLIVAVILAKLDVALELLGLVLSTAGDVFHWVVNAFKS